MLLLCIFEQSVIEENFFPESGNPIENDTMYIRALQFKFNVHARDM